MRKFLICLWALCAQCLLAQENWRTQRGVELYQEGQYAQAIPYFQQAAKEGDAQAQLWVGYMYLNGKGVSQDAQIGLNMINKSIAQDYLPAIVELGHCYRNGAGVPASPVKAFNLYKKAMSMGNSDGYFFAALCYRDGVGVTANEEEALRLLLCASEKGEKYADARAAEIYYKRGDEAHAFKHLEQASDARSEFNTYMLGKMYAEGKVTSQDLVKADKLLSSVSEKVEEAAALLREIAPKVEMARRRAYYMAIYSRVSDIGVRYTFEKEGNCTDTPSGRGKSYQFDGGKRLNIDNALYHTDIFSISFWIKDFGSGDVLRTIAVASGEDGFPNLRFKGRLLYLEPGLSPEVKYPFRTSLESLQTGGWHHLVVTFRHNTKKLYIDGALMESQEAKTAQISQGRSMSLGSMDVMKLDNLRFYKTKELTDEEVKSLYIMEKEGY